VTTRSRAAASLTPASLGHEAYCPRPCGHVDLFAIDGLATCAMCIAEALTATALAAAYGADPPMLPENVPRAPAPCQGRIERAAIGLADAWSDALIACERRNAGTKRAAPRACADDPDRRIRRAKARAAALLRGCAGTPGLHGYAAAGDAAAAEACLEQATVDNDSCERNCRLPRCGDSIVGPAEGCDDGNTAPCDGCLDCQREGATDGDRLLGPCDNCPQDYNPSQRDRDDNGIWDVCDSPVSIETPVGSDVLVEDDTGCIPGLSPDPIRTLTITYPVVSASGVTLIRTLEAPADSLIDADFKVSALGTLLPLETTASVSGLIRACAEYDDTSLSVQDEQALVFLHEENGIFVNRRSLLDTASNLLCADVTSFSRFAFGAPVSAMTKQSMTVALDPMLRGQDRIKRLSSTFLPPPSFIIDPTVTGVELTVARDGEAVLIRSIPSSLWQANGSRRAFKFSDRDGLSGLGITKGSVSTSRSSVQVLFVGNQMDLGGLDTPELTIKLDFGAYAAVGPAACTTKAGAEKTTVKCRGE
jgi:cysteine-rich repeat protein